MAKCNCPHYEVENILDLKRDFHTNDIAHGELSLFSQEQGELVRCELGCVGGFATSTLGWISRSRSNVEGFVISQLALNNIGFHVRHLYLLPGKVSPIPLNQLLASG